MRYLKITAQDDYDNDVVDMARLFLTCAWNNVRAISPGSLAGPNV